MVELKKCNGFCGLQKSLDDFSIRSDSGKYRNQCKTCVSEKSKKWAEENPGRVKEKNKKWYEENTERSKENSKRWAEENPEKIKESNIKWYVENKEEMAECYQENKEKILEYHKEYYEENKEDILIRAKEYRIENKEKITKYREEHKEENKDYHRKYNKKYNKERKRFDPEYRIRCYISASINKMLKSQGSSKGGQSILKFLPPAYFYEIKPHLQSQFKWWMTFENHGVYDPKAWDDNDPSTWKWQLDHIIPHSTFHYETMDCEEFRKCWALSNLRPLSAKQNQLDGATKSRHK